MKGITLRDVRFCFAVEKVTGVIHAEQGLALFYVPDKGIIARYPGNLTAKDYGTEKTVWMYPSTRKIKLRRGRDDVPVEELEDMDVDLHSEISQLESMIEEERIRRVPKVLSAYASIVAAIVVGVASAFFLKRSMLFAFPLAASVLLFLFNFIRGRSISKALSSPIVFDCDGAWLNLETGECSLNGGCIISHYSKEEVAL